MAALDAGRGDVTGDSAEALGKPVDDDLAAGNQQGSELGNIQPNIKSK